jgi:hypothetical protein
MQATSVPEAPIDEHRKSTVTKNKIRPHFVSSRGKTNRNVAAPAPHAQRARRVRRPVRLIGSPLSEPSPLSLIARWPAHCPLRIHPQGLPTEWQVVVPVSALSRKPHHAIDHFVL